MSAANAHDAQIDIDGDRYYVRRDFDLMRRIEQDSGSLSDLDARLRSNAVPVDRLFSLYRIILSSQQSRPTDDMIRAQIFEAGVQSCCNDIAVLVMQLFHGNRKTLAWLEAEAARGGDASPDPPKAV